MANKRDIILEYAKCAKNPAYTIETYFETFDLTQEGFVPFKLFYKQRFLIENYENNRFNLVLKYRQAGISTVTAAYCAVKTSFSQTGNPERILILANKQETAVEFLNKITTFIKQLPKWVNVSFTKSSQKHVRLSNGSELKAVATSTDALRGYTPTIMIMDEAAFIEGGQALWSACLAAIGCLDESTMILTDKGIVELSDIIENKVDIGFHSLTKDFSVVNKYNKLEKPLLGYKSEFTDTYTIKTKHGHTLTGSWKHPLIVSDEWKQMCKLEIGDLVKFGYNQQIFGDKTKINNDEFVDYEVPKSILQSTREVQISYVKYLFNNKLEDCEVKNEKFSQQVQYMLLNFGVRTKIYQKESGEYVISILEEYKNLFNKIFYIGVDADYKEFDYDNNYFYDEIIDIKKSEGWTYDLNLPQSNSFNSNGFISHNTGGKAFLISTPNGIDEIYYEAYEGAITNTNKFVITHLKWWTDPRFNKDLRLIKTDDIISWIQKKPEDKTEEIIENVRNFDVDTITKYIEDGYKPHSTWYENMCRDMNLNRRMINQELESAFVGSGDNVIASEVLRFQEENNVREPIFKDKQWDNNLWVWELPQKGHRYILGCDVSRGDSEDATGICIIDYDTYEQVLEYHGKVPPDIAAQIVDHYGRLYNALSTFDITGGMGIVATTKLKELNYPRHLFHYDNVNDDWNFMPSHDSIPGINFASKNRRSQIVAALEEAVSRGEFKIRSERLIAELRKFVYKNGKPDHLKGAHDDVIMSLGMCLFVADTSFKRLSEADNMTKALLSSWRMNSNELPKNEDYLFNRKVNNNPGGVNYNRDEDINNQTLRNTRDFSWLFGNIKKR